MFNEVIKLIKGLYISPIKKMRAIKRFKKYGVIKIGDYHYIVVGE